MHSVARLAIFAAAAGGVSAVALDKRTGCNRDNLLRCLVGSPSLAAPFCSSSVGVVVSTPTVYVASTLTVFATASTSTTSTTTATYTAEVVVNVKRSHPYMPAGDDLLVERTAPKTSLACIANLKPSPSAVSSACSCFSGEYTAPAVTVTTAAEPTTVYLDTTTLVVAATTTNTVTATSTSTTTRAYPTCGAGTYPYNLANNFGNSFGCDTSADWSVCFMDADNTGLCATCETADCINAPLCSSDSECGVNEACVINSNCNAGAGTCLLITC